MSPFHRLEVKTPAVLRDSRITNRPYAQTSGHACARPPFDRPQASGGGHLSSAQPMDWAKRFGNARICETGDGLRLADWYAGEWCGGVSLVACPCGVPGVFAAWAEVCLSAGDRGGAAGHSHGHISARHERRFAKCARRRHLGLAARGWHGKGHRYQTTLPDCAAGSPLG